MRRRDFLAGLSGVAAWPVLARAQDVGKVYRIGVFSGSTNPVIAPAYGAFLDEIHKAGFKEGQNLFIDERQTNQEFPALSAAAAEMVHSKMDALVALGSEPALRALLALSGKTPIIIVANNYDPIALGYVKSLAQPGGNVTGTSLRQTELAEKQVELLTQAFPDKAHLAVLWDGVSADQFSAAERRAKLLRLQVRSLKLVNPPYDFDSAFRMLAADHPQMLLVLSSPFFGRSSQHIVDLAFQSRLPTMFIFRTYVDAGGLMSYGADVVTMYRQSGAYVAKILKGAKPSDLPVEQAAKFDLVVNLKTARAMSIELPTSILLRADEVIE